MLDRFLPVLSLALAVLPVVANPPAPEAAPADRVRELLEQEAWVEALELARAGYARTPEDPETVAALGEALFRAGRLAEADALLTPWIDEPEVTEAALRCALRLSSHCKRARCAGHTASERTRASAPSVPRRELEKPKGKN